MNRRKVRLIPVLDVMHGQVVRAVGGRRNEYQPIRSGLVTSTNPPAVARALLDATRSEELYVADLDAILGVAKEGISRAVLTLLSSLSIPIWLDAGFGPNRDIPDLSHLPSLRPVVGLETCHGPSYVEKVLATHRPQRFAFSLDLRDGVLLGDWKVWGLQSDRDALGLARIISGVGCRSLIVLDLSRVGSGSGCGTDALVKEIRQEFPEIEIIAGGGVKNWEDVERMGDCGVDAVLVASAVHDGTLKVR